MSKEARIEFEDARDAQLQKNEARRIRTRVTEARSDIPRSGNRWPFELTQNAHDPGPRDGQDEVNISLSFDGHAVIYQHDGKPFSMQDLAALLSGGSSKDFESKATTGRFGTGFLQTHVLANQIKFEGILETATRLEKVHLLLDRSGDEDRIYQNTTACHAAVTEASPLPGLTGHPTACFTYVTDQPEAARMGLEAFSKTLPYLFGTCEHLGKVSIQFPDARTLAFLPEKPKPLQCEGLHGWERQVKVADHESPEKTIRIIRIKRTPQSDSSLVVILEQSISGWQVVLPPSGFPRLFCRFPIRTSDFLPVNVVVDGCFDPSQERDSILMTPDDKAQLTEALGLLPALVRLALHEKWLGGFKLARIGMPALVFGAQPDDVSKPWWKPTLSTVAENLAKLPIVHTANGEYHKISAPGPNADFVIPRFDANQNDDELNFTAVWESACQTKEALPPSLEIASDWTLLTQEWAALGVASERLPLTAIADLARHGTTKLIELKTTVPPLEWLSRFLNLVGQLVEKHPCAPILANLLPDQNGKLSSPANLKRDAGIEEPLKDIAAQMKLDIRSRLLANSLLEYSAKPEFASLQKLLLNQIPNILTSSSVIEECLQELAKLLPDDKPIPSDKHTYRDASLDLLLFLWKTQGSRAAELAKKCPLVSSDGTAVRWSPKRKIMAPVSYWHHDAQPFAEIYKSDRVLAKDYLTRFDNDHTLVKALVEWDMAFADPLCTDSPKELQGDRLKAIATVPGEVLNFASTSLSQIALLPSELIQRCQVDVTLAKSLFGLVLCYVARHDKSWVAPIEMTDKRQGVDVPFSLIPALWLADLKTRAWVPLPAETSFSQVSATAATLDSLLDSDWIKNNDLGIRLLTQHFGFNELELRLRATAPSDEIRHQLEGGLAQIVQTLGADPARYAQVATDLETKKRRDAEKQRNRKFGLAVQAAIKGFLEANDLNLVLIDNGYDYDLYLDAGPSVEAGTHHFKLADYLLEVKATTSGEVRLTPNQAQTASLNPERFILCVVDLREITVDRMEGEWTPADVEPKTKIYKEIGKIVNQPHALVTQAKECRVCLRNDNSLRYGVPVEIWEGGISVSTWIGELRKSTAIETDCAHVLKTPMARVRPLG